MQIIVGGSPSTGSSLLRQMLNRHSAIYCGPETKLFAFPVLFEEWESQKFGLVQRPFLTAPDVHLVRGGNLIGHEQQWDAREVLDLIGQCHSLPEFAEQYFRRPCEQYGKEIWAEKTPANVLSFRSFDAYFKDAVIVHIVRNPLDTIASLRSRGLPAFQATARYLYSTSFGLSARNLPGYVEVRYEDLVHKPESALADFFHTSGLEFEPQMLRSGNPAMTEADKMEGWTHRETDPPSKGAIGRFEKLPESEKEMILQAIEALFIQKSFADRFALDVTDIRTIAALLHYDLPRNIKPNTKIRRRLTRARLARMMNSLGERRAFVLHERPISVKSI